MTKNTAFFMLILLPVLFGETAAKIYGGDSSSYIAQSAIITAEITRLQTVIAEQNSTVQNRHDAWVRLGRLLHLSGDIEGAAAAWMKAAYAEQGKRDDNALLEAAACFIAIGEWDKAEANAKLVLITVRDDKNIFLKARYLAAQIEALRSGDDVILNALVDDPDYRSSRPTIYWTLWKLSGNPEYKAKLLTEFPDSPETRSMLAENHERSLVLEAPSPQWLLPPGQEMLTLEKISKGPAVPASGLLETGIPPALQTGVFNSRTNARSHAERLKRAGFTAEVSRRTTGNTEFWCVTVPTGSNMQRTIISLKDAGFEAFPVY
ncbi:MAG: SPOR domain-containing protein [Spirochaetaceae bacterium]|jgi:tetratricopeptide (TPR) repeat protein|nr:SPOR domain-containing protein [Spirochaetaceae bacterium]